MWVCISLFHKRLINTFNTIKYLYQLCVKCWILPSCMYYNLIAANTTVFSGVHVPRLVCFLRCIYCFVVFVLVSYAQCWLSPYIVHYGLPILGFSNVSLKATDDVIRRQLEPMPFNYMLFVPNNDILKLMVV